MSLLGDAAGWRGQAALWRLIDAGDLLVASQDAMQMARMQSLIRKYRDLPMDLADASLVAAGEDRGLRDIFTLDRRDFSVYRLRGRTAFRVWPKID